MSKDTLKTKTKVIFRKIEGREVIAIFPKIEVCQGCCDSYTILGQHGACSPEWVEDGEIPTIDECVTLINELERLGYNLLFAKK